MDRRDANDLESEVGLGCDDEKVEKMERNGSSSFSERSAGGLREPLLLSRSRMNNTSQIAMVGANVCPIESLDYEYAFGFLALLHLLV